MKVLVVHLSDIHVRGEEDRVLGRATKIAEAVRNLEHDLSACFVVVSGDSAFSGSEEQYWLALGLLQELKNALDSYLRLDVGVRFVVVPGNHDCDFTLVAEGVRERLIGTLQKESVEAHEDEVVEECTNVQRHFFEYAQQLDEGQLDLHGKLFYEYCFDVNGRQILFRCYNTAWLSQRHEKQGQLAYPIDVAEGMVNGFALNVTVFHHPYNWMSPENARAFKKHVEGVSDVILTGHEHDQTRQVRVGDEGERNLYIEGGVLQDNGDDSVSSFNALVLEIDQDEAKQKFFHFSWDGQIYAPIAGSSSDWEALQVNKLIARQDFEVSEKFERYLEDPGVQLSHPSKGNLVLSDIFVSPDLREVTHEYREEVPRLVKVTDILDQILEQQKLMVLGADKSGKTSLAKILFSGLRARGLVPVLIDGSSFRVRTDRVDEDVAKLFEDQYSPKLKETFTQLHRSERVLVVDDFDRLDLRNPTVRERFLRALTNFADGLVLLSNDQAQHVRELVGGEAVASSVAGLPRYEIQELGHVLREDLIGRWFSLSEDHAFGAAELARDLNHAHRVLDTLIGKNFVPSYPVFVLSVLQALEVGTPIDTNASTYGYFYELFIKTSLAETSAYIEYDVKTAYLSFLAYRLYARSLREPTLDDLKSIHREYENAYELTIPFETLLEDLEKARILDSVSGAYRFKYRYIYYYFVASYIKDNVSNGEVRSAISDMSEKIYVEENANILLFLAHLIKDQFAIEEMLARARNVFADYTPANLEDDATIFSAVEAVRYRDSDVSSSRRATLQRMDDVKEAVKSSEDELDVTEAPEDEVFEFDVAMKTIQILGQMLKNFPGSLLGDVKAKLARECYELGMRALAAVFAEVKEHREELVDAMIDRLKTTYPESIPPQDLEMIARKNVVNFAQVLSYAVVKHVAHSIGAPKLDKTYKRVLEDEEGVAAARLVHHAIKLDHEAHFPKIDTFRLGESLKTNLFSLSLLRHLIVNHFYMFHEDFTTRQSVCNRLGISYEKAARIPNPELRKLEGSP